MRNKKVLLSAALVVSAVSSALAQGNGLAGINKTVMLVVGTSDVITPQAVSARMAGQINGSWLVRFQGLPHIGNRNAPVQYGENAVYFLDTNEAPLASP